MDVQVERTFVIPPPPSEPEKVQFTVFDLLAPSYHYTALYAFTPPNPTNDALIAGLTAVLPLFPLLTARLDHNPATDRPFFVTGKGGAGALVVETTVPAALSDHLPLAPTPDRVRLHAPLPEDTPHMLQVQVNRFACGGLVVGLSTHHWAADGYSTIVFLRAWADTVRNDGVLPMDRPAPYGPRAHEDEPSLPPPVVVVPASEITNLVLHYTGEFVEALRASVGHKFTKFETLAAHLWRKITAASGRADDDGRTTLHVTVNGRPRLGPEALAKGFFGNVVLTARSGTAARDVARRGGLADVAALVRKGVRAVDAAYFQSFIDFGALHGEEELEPVSLGEDNELSHDVMVDSWMHLEMHRLDFGCGGRQAGILPTHVPGDGVVMLIPSFREEGGVDAFVAIWEKHVNELKRIAYTMD
ncbi:hypothetical protein QOZ80_2BG0186390 [Eleusine coracana subsp. coracana]|nr:hypothetical protein QOZ80_2BG0186390 [Eleusine coracana subsp. coracana]